MADKRDFYDVLGVKKNASKDEIKSSYRKLAKQYHPDNKQTGNEAKFKEVQEAYDVLYDDQKRSAYDQFGHAAFEQAGNNPGGNPFQGGFGGFSDMGVDLGDIFSSFFGGGSRRRTSTGPRRGNDAIMRVKIDFMDAVLGKDIVLPITVDEKCPKCNGTGAKSPSSIQKCPHCGGLGRVRVQRRSILGMVETEETCPHCGGTGKIILEKCPNCNGQGYNRVKKDVKVHILAGINTGQQIRVTGMGERGSNGGENGDLYVEIIVKEHAFFKRDGNDIHINMPIDYIDAILGISVDIPTVYGEATLNIPSGTQPNQVLRMKGQGIKDLRTGKPGDQYIHLDIKMPTNINKNQKDLLTQLRASTSDSDRLINKFKRTFRK